MAHYFLHNRLLASGSQPMWADDRPQYDNQIYICPVCGDPWARVAVSDNAQWYPIRAPCAKHTWNSETLGGSFIRPWRRGFGELPQAVIAYELDLLLKEIENELC